MLQVKVVLLDLGYCKRYENPKGSGGDSGVKAWVQAN